MKGRCWRKRIQQSHKQRGHQLISSLPKLFYMVHLLFQSINRLVLTKEELMFKIITSHCDIIDRGEIKEQLKLLLELAPEYTFEKSQWLVNLILIISKLRMVALLLVKMVTE